MRFPGETYVKPALIDTDILSLFFRGHPAVTARFETYLADFEKVNISIITYYEILSGLKHRDAHRKMEIFLKFVSENTVLPYFPPHSPPRACHGPDNILFDSHHQRWAGMIVPERSGHSACRSRLIPRKVSRMAHGITVS
jgi:hypothetical protein